MKKILFILISALLLFIFVSCDNGIRQVSTSELNRKVNAEGLTAEQANIKKRLELASDSNKIWWIYCLADNGQVVFYGAVKGKITSSGKYLDKRCDTDGCMDIQPDGSYGHSDSYVYWFDPSGAYYQWSGHYFVSSKEVKIKNAVLNIRSVK